MEDFKNLGNYCLEGGRLHFVEYLKEKHFLVS